MRRGGPAHPKVLLLAAALGVPRYAAVGLLECLWHWTAAYAPRGNIGAYDDAMIAASVGWTEDPAAFVGTLVRCGFLDLDPTFRLAVHDWHVHADQSVQRVLTRLGTWFINTRKGVGKTPSSSASRRLASAVAEAEAGAEASLGGEEREKGGAFAAWYAAYPKKRKPAKARAAWERQRTHMPPLARMLEVLAQQKRSADWQREGGQFIPYPEAYLNGHCWADVAEVDLGRRTGPVRNLELERIAQRERELARG
jgi:hypothetical protein